MLDIKKLLTKILGTLLTLLTTMQNKQDTLTVETISTSATTTTGTYVSSICRRYGNIVWLSVTVRNTSSISGGSNIYEGTFASTLPAPLNMATGGTYYASHAIMGSLDTARKVIIRNASNTAVTIGSSSTSTVTFVYMTND